VRRLIFDHQPSETDAASSYASVIEANEAGNSTQRRRFAGAIVAKEHNDCLRHDSKGDAVQPDRNSMIRDLKCFDSEKWCG
jgi:hypothetical protein